MPLVVLAITSATFSAVIVGLRPECGASLAAPPRLVRYTGLVYGRSQSELPAESWFLFRENRMREENTGRKKSWGVTSVFTSKSLECTFVCIGQVARSRISLRISGSAMTMPLLICASGFSHVGRSDSYSIFAMGTCEFIERGISIGVPVFPGRSYPGQMEVTSSPIEQQRHA